MIYHASDLTFQILSVGQFVHQSGLYRVLGRPYAALSLRLRGYGRFEVNGTKFSSSPGDIVFIAENTDYQVEYSDGESIAVHLLNCNYKVCENIATGGSAPVLRDWFAQLLEYWAEPNQVNGAKSAVYRILQLLADHESLRQDDCFARCVSFIHAHFCDPQLSVRQICRAGYISEATLRRKFQKYCNISPKQYILRCRLNRAMALLIRGEQSVKEIAWVCGFRDEKFFSRTIRQRYGRPPSQFAGDAPGRKPCNF